VWLSRLTSAACLIRVAARALHSQVCDFQHRSAAQMVITPRKNLCDWAGKLQVCLSELGIRQIERPERAREDQMAKTLTKRGGLLLTVATLLLCVALLAGCSDNPLASVTPDTPDTPDTPTTGGKDYPGPLAVEAPDNAPGDAPAGPASK
jgi:hypothetical protein